MPIPHKNIMCVTVPELVQCGVSENTINSGTRDQRNGKVTCWEHHKEGRVVYIHFDTLKSEYKTLVQEKLCGGLQPQEFMKTEIIRSYCKLQPKDIDYLMDYQSPAGRRLELEHIEKCKKACALLHFLAATNLHRMKSIGFAGAPEFYETVAGYIEAEDMVLPRVYQRLRDKIKEYQQLGAECIVHKGRGNENSKKLNELHHSYIKELLRMPNQLRFEVVCKIYNNTAGQNTWPQISVQTVKNMYTNNKAEIDAHRKGKAEWRCAYDYIVKRTAPTQPGILWVGDVTPYELYYQETRRNAKDKSETSYWKRLVVYVVIDAFNDYVVGWAAGDQECNELAKMAWKNACVSHGIMPYQLVTDNYGINPQRTSDMAVFYQKLALNADFFTPAAVGNARSKPIEAVFGRIYDAVTRFHDNASGRNITAKERLNTDNVAIKKKYFPLKHECLKQIEGDMLIWNALIDERIGKCKSVHWKEAVLEHPFRMLDDYNRLAIFGTQHTYTNQLTNNGLEFTVDGTKRNYMLLDTSFIKTAKLIDYQVTYDVDDWSKILITANDGSIRYVLEENKNVPMAYMDMGEGDRTNLNKKLDFRKETYKKLVDEPKAREQKILENAGIDQRMDIAGYMKTRIAIGGSNKQLMQAAEDLSKDLSRIECKPDEFDKALPAARNKSTKKTDEEIAPKIIDEFDMIARKRKAI